VGESRVGVCVELQIVAIGCRYQGVWRGSELRNHSSVRCKEETWGRRIAKAQKKGRDRGKRQLHVCVCSWMCNGWEEVGREGKERCRLLKAGRPVEMEGRVPVRADASVVSVTFEKPKLYRLSVGSDKLARDPTQTERHVP
jgi:hypothetical protein